MFPTTFLDFLRILFQQLLYNNPIIYFMNYHSNVDPIWSKCHGLFQSFNGHFNGHWRWFGTSCVAAWNPPWPWSGTWCKLRPSDRRWTGWDGRSKMVVKHGKNNVYIYIYIWEWEWWLGLYMVDYTWIYMFGNGNHSTYAGLMVI